MDKDIITYAARDPRKIDWESLPLYVKFFVNTLTDDFFIRCHKGWAKIIVEIKED